MILTIMWHVTDWKKGNKWIEIIRESEEIVSCLI